MNSFFVNLLFFFEVLILTTLVGYPLTNILKIESVLAKSFLGFSLGFGAISLSGVLANVLHLPVFEAQLVISGILLSF
jgi:hypothetical protein